MSQSSASTVGEGSCAPRVGERTPLPALWPALPSPSSPEGVSPVRFHWQIRAPSAEKGPSTHSQEQPAGPSNSARDGASQGPAKRCSQEAAPSEAAAALAWPVSPQQLFSPGRPSPCPWHLSTQELPAHQTGAPPPGRMGELGSGDTGRWNADLHRPRTLNRRACERLFRNLQCIKEIM